MKNLLISFASFIFGILNFTGLVNIYKSQSDADTFGTIFLVASLVFAFLGVRNYSKDWTKRKKTLIQIGTFIGIVSIWLLVSSIISMIRIRKPQTEERNSISLKGKDNVGIAENEILTNEEREVFKELMDVADEVNKVLPMMVDKETRFDNTFALPGRKVINNYTLINYLSEDIDTVMYRNTLKEQLINNLKTTPEMDAFRKLNVVMIYRYRDKENNHICNITINPEDYQ